MKHYISFFIFVFAVVISLSSCKAKQDISSMDVKVNDTITVVLKDTITINLVSNPSTGYRWQYVEKSGEKNVKFLDDVFTAPKTEMVGKAGTQTFSFLANKKGSTILEFKYARGGGTPAKTHKVWVIINKK